MIPKAMEAFLSQHLPDGVIRNRMFKKNGCCFLELSHRDENLLGTVGITPDRLGPFLVVFLWDEADELEVGGYLVVDNLSMGSPSMGGIRMLPDITPLDIHNLARGMTLKNGAADLPYGGGKSGIVAPNREVSAEEHTLIIRRFARLIQPYQNMYLPGPDVGTDDGDMKTIAMENGLDTALSKTADMGGNRIDQLGAAAGGVVIAIETLLKIMPRLKVLSQFSDMEVPKNDKVTVLFQGFGAVGAHGARIMAQRLPLARIVGLSDKEGYLFNGNGLSISEIFQQWFKHKLITWNYFHEKVAPFRSKATTRFSTDPNGLLRESAFCLVPAAPVFNYLGVDPTDEASMTVDKMGNWRLVVEGANTYSPDPIRKAQRTRMEQVVFQNKGVMIANDYLVNSGGVIFAAQEHMIPTPEHLQIPKERLGKPEAVQQWLDSHGEAFKELALARRKAGGIWREKVIRSNMDQLVGLLAADSNLLPNQAAERISLGRLTAKEGERTAEDIMIPMAKVRASSPVQEAARRIVEHGGNIAAVVDEANQLNGVITAWDITKSLAGNSDCSGVEVLDVMMKKVIMARPQDTMVQVLRKLEENRISAVPVVKDGKVLGLVNSDLLAYRYLHSIAWEK